MHQNVFLIIMIFVRIKPNRILTSLEKEGGMKMQEEMETKLTERQIAEAIALYCHLLEHPEVQKAPYMPGKPMCKICNKTSEVILDEREDEEYR